MIAPVILALGSNAAADFALWTTDRDEWESATGEFTTIDFTDHPPATILNDQYAHLGVNFEGNTFFWNSGNFIDGMGMTAVFTGAWTHFDQPIQSLAASTVVGLAMDLYLDGELVTSEILGGTFFGFIADVPFDTVHFYGAFGSTVVSIDDLHFGMPIPAPASGVTQLGDDLFG